MLSLSVTQTVHLVNNTVYLTLCGIPSGHPITTPLNDIVHHILLRMGWIDITKEPLSLYDEHVEEVTYGDDELVNVSDEFADRFNCVTLSNWYAEFDFIYTDASKVGNIAYQTLEQETFLKRTFTRHPNKKGMWLAPLDMISITECAQWVWKSPSIKEATLLNVKASLELSYGHGPKFFKQWFSKLKDACNKEGLEMPNVSWTELDAMFFPNVPDKMELIFTPVPVQGQTKKEEKVIYLPDLETHEGLSSQLIFKDHKLASAFFI